MKYRLPCTYTADAIPLGSAPVTVNIEHPTPSKARAAPRGTAGVEWPHWTSNDWWNR